MMGDWNVVKAESTRPPLQGQSKHPLGREGEVDKGTATSLRQVATILHPDKNWYLDGCIKLNLRNSQQAVSTRSWVVRGSPIQTLGEGLEALAGSQTDGHLRCVIGEG